MTAPSRILSAACVVVVALAVLVHVTTDDALAADVSYLGVMIGASVVAWAGVLRWPRGRRRLPCLIAAGVTLTALGDLLWTLLERAGAGTDASVADVAWFASYVFLCAALWTVLSQSRVTGRADVDFVVDAVTIVVISVLVFWTLSVEGIVDDDTISPFVRVVWAAYPVLDAVLLALVLRVLMSRRARAAIDVWFAVGVCLWLAADVLYLHVTDHEGALRLMDAAWMVAPALLARAAWKVREELPKPSRTSMVSGNWMTQLGLAVLPLAVPPVLEVIADLRGREDQPLQLLIGTVAVIVLAFIRTGRLILSDQRTRRELEVARDAALAASDAKSMFLANMSHELRTPLTTVIAAGGLLAETPLSDTQQMLLGKVHRSGGQLQSLVEGILDFSRIEAGRAELDHAEFDLQALVSEIIDTHRARAAKQGVGLVSELDPAVPHVLTGDRTRVFQVLSNLVENALKFTERGQVHLGVTLVDESTPGGGQARQVQFAVSDTGIGISEADQASIFESFSQVDGSSTRRYQGTGLGLAICKKLAELMGGTITVSSALGVGSTFTVRLPLAPSSAKGPGPGPGPESAQAPSTPEPAPLPAGSS
jgi:signal transduction histidine kinase